jgi:hypothetical protein
MLNPAKKTMKIRQARALWRQFGFRSAECIGNPILA